MAKNSPKKWQKNFLEFFIFWKKNRQLKKKQKKSTASEAVFKNTKDLLNIISICNMRWDLKGVNFPSPSKNRAILEEGIDS